MHIGNFTPDPVTWMHLGIEGTIKPDQVLEYDDARGRHILNKFAVRGLVQMVFGDKPESKRGESMGRWKSFWETQVINFNRYNESQKENHNRYTDPSKELREHAAALNLELISPWRVESKDSPKVAVLEKENLMLREENAGIKKSLLDVQKQMAEMMEMFKAKIEAPATPDPKQDVAANAVDGGAAVENDEHTQLVELHRNKYKRLNKMTLHQWVGKHWSEITEMPEENKVEIAEMYEKIYDVPFPSEPM